MSTPSRLAFTLSRRAAIGTGIAGVATGALAQGPATDELDVHPLTHWSRDTFTYLPIGENENSTAAVTFPLGPDGATSAITVENLDLQHQGTFSRDEATAP